MKQENVMDEVKKLTKTLKDKDSLFQVLAPMYDGELGINALNIGLRDILNDNYNSGEAKFIKHGDVNLYEGDRIIITKNDYKKMIYNGDSGKTQKISVKDNEVEIRIFDWFDSEAKPPQYLDKIFTFTIEEARERIKVAYVVSIHRYQGKENDYIILPMTTQYSSMLYRNLIYTALTRARKKVFLLGDPRAFQIAVDNDRESTRNSQLSKLISDYSEIALAASIHDS